MIMYHATAFENLVGIFDKGLEPRNAERIVYLTHLEDECIKFAIVHGVKKILVLEVEVDENKMVETFDHSEAFFKCRCFGYPETIPNEKILNYTKYEL